jgi:hypothetical protein
MSRIKAVIVTSWLATLLGLGWPGPVLSMLTEPAVPAVVTFQPRPLGTARNFGGDDEVSLEITGIAAISNNVAVTYGVSSLGSVLLRTQDGGRRWQETMNFDSRSRVVWAGFANSQVGWALLEDYWGEAGGPITIHRTLDGGKTWQALSSPPTKVNYWGLLNVRILSSRQVQVDVEDAAEIEEAADVVFRHETSDGGKTWRTTRLKETRAQMLDRYQKSGHPFNRQESTGFDGSQWQVKVDYEKDKTITIQRRAMKSGAVRNFSMPVDWSYARGRIVLP